MRFQAAHKTVSYGLVLSALFALLSAEAITLPLFIISLLVLAVSWPFDPRTRWFEKIDRHWSLLRWVVLVVFFWFGWRFFLGISRDGLPDANALLDLVLFLLGYKLFQRKSNRDFLQIYILTFLLVLASSVAATGLLFALAFAAYVVMAVWTLLLFHLRREMEDNYLVKHSQDASEKVAVERILNSRRVVGPSFFAATGMVAAVVLVGAAVTFLLFPRVGLGFFFGRGRAGRTLVGFSDEVRLGHHGVLSTENHAVAIRARVSTIEAIASESKRDTAISGLYWRGTVYESYHLGRWERARDPALETHLETVPWISPVTKGSGIAAHVRDPFTPHTTRRVLADRLGKSDVIRQEIDVVGVSTPVAFALDPPLAFEAPPMRMVNATQLSFQGRWSGEVALHLTRRFVRPGGTDQISQFNGARYVAYSANRAEAIPLAGGDSNATPEQLAAYLTIPEPLSPRVVELARRVTVGKATPMEKVTAISNWLEKNYRYTTDLRRDQSIRDPLEDFLFHQKAGHCEYFASAAAVLLRLNGVPTRYVNGFLGGEWNDINHHITVRDNRAHSWVEAYMGTPGWLRVDATPPGPPLPHMNRLRQFMDYLELQWSRWVIDYSLSRQVELVRQFTSGRRVAGRVQPRWSGPSRKTVGFVVLGLFGAGVIGWVWRKWPRSGEGQNRAAQRARSRRRERVFRLYERTLTRLARWGHQRRPAETPREFATRLSRAPVRGTDAVERLSELYGMARYGGRSVENDVIDELERLLRDAGKPLAPTKEPKPPSASAAP